MFVNPHLGSLNFHAFRMPHELAENERYMHDSTDAVLKKYSSATKLKKQAEFSGGIWDISEKDIVAQSNEEDPADFLLNIISQGNDDCVQDMEEGENDNFVKSPVIFSHEISKVFCSEDDSAMKNKRWRTEEVEDKSVRISDKGTDRKRSKKTLSFSNSPVKKETSETKSSNTASKSPQLEHASITDASFEMKDATNIMEIVGKRSNKLDDRGILISQSNARETVIPTEDPLLHVEVDNRLQRSQLSKKVVSMQLKKMAVKPQKSNILSTTVLKEETSEEINKISNFNVSKTGEKRAESRMIQGHDSVLTNTLQTPGSVREKVPVIEMSLDKPKCSKSETSSKMKNKIADSDILKSIEELLGDGDFLSKKNIKVNPKITKSMKGNAVSKMTSVQKNKDTLKKPLKDPTIKSEQLQEVFMPDEQRSEDESHLRKLKLDKKKIESPSQTDLDVPSVADVIKPKGKLEMIAKQSSAIFSSDKMMQALNENHSNNFFSHSKNQFPSFNWRDDCTNIRQSTRENDFKASDSFNWRDHCIGSKKSEKDYSTASSLRRTGRHGYGGLSDHREFFHFDETEDKMESSDDEKLKKMLLKIAKKVKEPEPLSRFQGIGNPDPESIWDLPAKSKSPQTQKINKTIEKTEEIYTQSHEAKKIKIPNFFGTPAKTFSKQSLKVDEKLSQNKKSDDLELKRNDCKSSRSHKEYYNSKTCVRSRSASVNWRNTCANNYSNSNDSIIIVSVRDKKNNVVEQLKVRKDEFFELKKEIKKLFHLIPDPDEFERKVKHSALAVKIFIRCLFSRSYTLPDWKTVLETYAIAKKFDLDDLQIICQEYFANPNLSLKLVDEIAKVAKCFNVVEALKSAEIFPDVEKSARSLVNSSSCNESCVVSCTTYIEPSEFCIPLKNKDYQGIEGTNSCDLQNIITFKCISGVIHVMGIQLKLQAHDALSKNEELIIHCDVDKDGRKIFDAPDVCKKINKPLIIPFEKGLILKAGEELEITALIEDIYLRMCSQLDDEEFLSSGKFHAFFKSDKTNSNKKPLFFIEKIIYTFRNSKK